MDTYRNPVVEVGLADQLQRRYTVEAGDDGFFCYDRIADLAKIGKLRGTTFDANTLLQFGNKAKTHVIAVDRKYLKGVLLRPLLRQPLPWERGDGTPTRRWQVTTSLGGDDWSTAAGTVHNDFWDFYTFLPTAAANWDFSLASDGLLWEMTQKVSYTGDGDTISDWTTSAVGFKGKDVGSELYAGQTPNPFFTAGFRRQGLPPEFLAMLKLTEDAAAVYAYTDIIWGAHPTLYPEGKWCLHVPVQGKPCLYQYERAPYPWEDGATGQWSPRRWTEGTLREKKASKASEEGYTFHIGHFGHAVCVSTDAWEDLDDDFAYYLAEGEDEPICPGGEVVIRNFPGQCTFWLDLNVLPLGAVRRWPLWVPAWRQEDVIGHIWGQPRSEVLATPLQQTPTALSLDDPAEVLPDVEGLGALLIGPGTPIDGEEANVIDYGLQLMPGTYPAGADPTTEVVTQTTPFVEGVTLWQPPDLTDNGAPTFTTSTQGVLGFEATAELRDDNAGTQDLEVVNALEVHTPPEGTVPSGGWSPTHDFRVGRQVQVTRLGWMMTGAAGAEVDATESFGYYWIIRPRRGARRGEFRLTDLLGMLALNVWNGETELNFRGWPVKDALEFAMEYNGIGPAWYEFEDTGLTVPGDDDHCHKRGTSWLKVVKRLVDRGGDVYYDPLAGKIKSGCRYCRQARTAETLLAHCDNGWASSACLVYDLTRVPGTGVDLPAVLRLPDSATEHSLYPAMDFEAEEATLDDKDYANVITVVGRRQTTDRPDTWARGPDIIARWRNSAVLDWDSSEGGDNSDYQGWPVGYVDEDNDLNSESSVWKRLAERVAEKGPKAKRPAFRVPLAPWVQPGMVTTIAGAEAAECEGLKFRIVKVTQEAGRGRTRVGGREMRGA